MITVENLGDVLLIEESFVEVEQVEGTSIKVYAQQCTIVIGSHVKLKNLGSRHDGYGIAIAIVDDSITVLWSIEPTHVDDPLKNFLFPVIRQAQNPLPSCQLVSIQPMSIPAGLVFYLEHTYGSGSRGEA